MTPTCFRFAYMSGFALAMAVQACGAETRSEDAGMSSPGVERDGQVGGDAQASGDAGDPDSGSERSPGEGGTSPGGPSDCFDPGSVPSCETFSDSAPSSRPSYVELLNAASLGEGARFVAMGGSAALARRPASSGPEWVVAALAVDPETQRTVIHELRPTWENAGGRYTVVDVWGRPAFENSPGSNVFALACRMGSCVILSARRQADEALTPLRDVELDAGIESELRGLVVDSDRICVFGDGLYCYEVSDWRELLGAAEAPGLRDVSFGDPDVAVGEAGLVYIHDRGGWRRVDVGASKQHAFERADTKSGRLTLVRDDGALVRGTPGALRTCRPQEGRFVLAKGYTVADEAGSIFIKTWKGQSQMRDWCVVASAQLESPVVGYATETCAASTNFWVLTEQSWINRSGENLWCVLVD